MDISWTYRNMVLRLTKRYTFANKRVGRAARCIARTLATCAAWLRLASLWKHRLNSWTLMLLLNPDLSHAVGIMHCYGNRRFYYMCVACAEQRAKY